MMFGAKQLYDLEVSVSCDHTVGTTQPTWHAGNCYSFG